MNNKFNSFLSKRNKIENFVSLLEVASSRGISGYVFVRNILRPVLENKNWNNLNQFVNIISRKLNNLNEAIIDPADPGKIITRKTFTPEDQKRRMKLHDELFNTVKEELKKHIKEAQYKAGYFLKATEKHDDPGEKAKARATLSMLDHLTKVINNHIDNYKLKYKTEFTDDEYNAELAKRAALSGDFEKGADSIISQFTREKLRVKHVSFAELLNKLAGERSGMQEYQKLKLSFTVDQLINDVSVSAAHKAQLKSLANILPPPPKSREELTASVIDIRTTGTEDTPWYSNETLDRVIMLGATKTKASIDNALDAVVTASVDHPVDIRKEIPVQTITEVPPENLEAKVVEKEPVKSLTDDDDDATVINPEPTVSVPEPNVVGRDKNRAARLVKELTAEEKNYYQSIGHNNYKKSRFLDATPEQRQQIMNNDPIQRSLFPSSSPTDSDNITDWTKNNIGTFKQFVERFYR